MNFTKTLIAAAAALAAVFGAANADHHKSKKDIVDFV